MTHHEFAPSSLQRVHDCPGSYRLCKQVPPLPKSPESDEGTLLHERVVSGDLSGLDSEQSSAVESCIQFRESIVTENALTKSEKKLEIKGSSGDVITSGTIDFLSIDNALDHAHIIDWKFGRNMVIEAAGNYQLAAYALGVFQRYNVASVTAHIYQPRIYSHTEYTFTNPANIQRNIERIIARATAPELVLKAGESQCRYCAAKSICPAFSAAFRALETVPNEPRDLSNPSVLLDWWNKAQVVEKVVKELKDRVTDYCKEHGTLGDWYIQERQGRREVTNSVELCQRIDKLITAAEWRSCNSVNLGKLTDLMVEKIKAREAVEGKKLTTKAAKEQVENLIGDLIQRGEPTSVLARKEKK